MAFKYADRVKETTTTTGTGTITLLGAATDFRAFTSALSVGDSTAYCIQDLTNHTWEIGVGTLATANTLTRDTVLDSSTGSAISFAAGTKDVFITLPAERINTIADNTAAVGTAGTYTLVTTDAYGRVTSGTNPTTLTGYGITDAPTLTGTGASGTWGINISGNAISATTAASLTTARTINGVSFDGSANIVINAVDSTAREASITAGTTEQYWRGDKSWQSFPTSLPASDVSAWAKAGTKPAYTASEVGLGNVNNTDDTAKPVSTAQQTALNLKANLADPTFTGTVGGITAVMVGAPSGSGSSTGTNTGDQTTISGNAGSATVLQTARTINGVPFNGSADITINAADSTARVASSLLGAVSGVATLDATGKVPSTQLPSYVDDVIEGANLAAFPGTGEAAKIYVALDTNKTYRWSGSAYIYITSGAVDSVAGKTGVVTLVRGDVGLGNVDNTSDANKPVSTAQAAADSAVQTAAASDATTKANAAQANAIAASAPVAHVGSGGAAHANVVAAGAAGFMTGADKSKLDGISGTNTGDQTNISGNAATATTAGTAGTFSSSRTTYKGVTDGAVAGQLMWKNYGNNHTIFDASNSTSPDGGAVNNTNSAQPWGGSYPTLMGWNGNSTYGVRVDSARISDSCSGSATYAANSSRLYSTDSQYAYGSGAPYYGYLTYDGSRWLFQVNPASPSAVRVAYADSAGSAPANGGTSAACSGNAATATSASKVTGPANTTGTDGWWRSDGASGWYSSSYAVGIYATEAGNVRTYNGANLIAGGNVTAYSDERLKKDWTPLQTDFVYRLAQVKSGTYTRIDGLKLRQVGVGAQSLQGLMPEAILSGTDGMLSVAYGNAALAACVELAKEVVELKKRLAALE